MNRSDPPRGGLQNGYCRCCLVKGYHMNMNGEHYWDGVREVYADIIEECFGLSVMQSALQDGQILICSSCVQRVRDASHFKMMVLSSGEQLKRLLDEGDFSTVFNQEDAIKTEVFEDDNDVLNNDQSDDDTSIFNVPETNGFSTFSVKKYAKKDYKSLLRDFLKRGGKPLPKRSILPEAPPLDFTKYKGLLKGNLDLENFTETFAEVKYKNEISKTEKTAHIANIETVLKFSNATPFKGKKIQGFPCFYCTVAFRNLQDLKSHVHNEHENVNLENLLWKHGAESIVLYVDVTDLKCTICDVPTKNLNELKSHLTDKHKKKIFKHVTDRIVPFKLSSENKNECQICGFNFETFGSIERHMNTHFRNYVCKECGSGFITKYRLKTHSKNTHVHGKNFTCDICKKEFFTSQKLKCHTDSVHKMTKRFKCPHCHERFTEYFKRQKHLVERHDEPPLVYKCNVCDKVFEKRYGLSKHQKKDHLEERNFQCHLCVYRCFTKHELQAHMIKHGGERIHECGICKKSYARKKTLREHMRIHNDDKRFSCVVCGQGFIQKCSLKGHMKSQHPEYEMR